MHRKASARFKGLKLQECGKEITCSFVLTIQHILTTSANTVCQTGPLGLVNMSHRSGGSATTQHHEGHHEKANTTQCQYPHFKMFKTQSNPVRKWLVLISTGPKRYQFRWSWILYDPLDPLLSRGFVFTILSASTRSWRDMPWKLNATFGYKIWGLKLCQIWDPQKAIVYL